MELEAYGHSKISIHALCEEGDLSMRHRFKPAGISIHALCEEGDWIRRYLVYFDFNFYPRPLRGGRHNRLLMCGNPTQFLSTPSARRATSPWLPFMLAVLFLSTPSARRATKRF